MSGGLIHIYTGDGKGKTTAALGLSLRAAGHGLRVVIVQFLKGRDTGEIHALEQIPDVTVLRFKESLGFFSSASDDKRHAMMQIHDELLAEAKRLTDESLCDILVLDEICAAYRYGALDKSLADEIVLNKSPELELVLTGRDAPEHWVAIADYVSEVVMRRHPHKRGIAARRGIEF